MQSMFSVPFYIQGTLSANPDWRWTVPTDVQLVHVSAVSANAQAGEIKIGSSSDDDAYLTASHMGVSSTPAEFDRNDFVGGEFPHIAKGTVLCVAIDYDHTSGSAITFPTVVMTFTEG